jgi:hypothetical protein
MRRVPPSFKKPGALLPSPSQDTPHRCTCKRCLFRRRYLGRASPRFTAGVDLFSGTSGRRLESSTGAWSSVRPAPAADRIRNEKSRRVRHQAACWHDRISVKS